IDVEVGGRIRTRRLLLGMNQQALADALDLTFQQVQKYEHGANRVSASRLAAMAKILAAPISYFFADLLNVREKGRTSPFGARATASGIGASSSLLTIPVMIGSPTDSGHPGFAAGNGPSRRSRVISGPYNWREA